MPKDLPQDVVSPPPAPDPQPFNRDAGGRPGGPTEMEVYARRGVNPQSVMQDLWNQAERRARQIVRAPQRLHGSKNKVSARTFFHPEFMDLPEDTSDQMVLDVAVGLLQQDYADEVAANAEFIKDLYATESADIVSKAPQMFLHGAINLDWALNHSLAESIAWLSEQLGDTHTAAYLSTFMLSDDVSAIKTRALLADIAGSQIDTEGAVLVADRGSATSSDLLQSIISSPDPMKAFRGLNPQDQYLVQQLAQQITTQGEQVLRLGEAKTADAVWVYGSGRFSLVLDQREQGVLNELAQRLYSLDAGIRDDLHEVQDIASEIGVDQLKAIDGGIIVLDEDWAKANPDKLAGIKAFLEQRYPEAEIQVGPQGVIGSVLDFIGEPADAVGSFLGAVSRQVSELIERAGTSQQDRDALAREAARLQWELDNGMVPEDEVDDTLHEIGRLQEDATDSAGWEGLYQDMVRAQRNRVVGGGFGELMTNALGIMPGDAGYDANVGLWTMLGQVAFDPINYVLPIVRGAALAARIPLSGLTKAQRVFEVVDDLKADAGLIHELSMGRTDAQVASSLDRIAQEVVRNQERVIARGGVPDAVHGMMTRRIYARLAKTPDQFIGTDRFINMADHLVGLNKAINNERISSSIFARSGYFSPSHAQLVAQARNREDMILTLSSVLWPVDQNPNVARISQELNDIDDLLAAGRATSTSDNLHQVQAFQAIETDLRARRQHLTSLLGNTGIPRDGVQLPTRRTIERIMQLGEEQRKLPRGYMQQEDGLLLALADDRPGWQNRFWFRMNHLWRQNGLGRELHFSGPQLGESIDFLQDFARGLQIPERRITELLAPLLSGELRHDDDVFRWWEETWERMIKESPTLDAAGRERMGKWYTPYVGERTPSFIKTPAYTRAEMTLPWGIREEDAISGFPVIDADVNVNGGIRLPDARQMRQYQSVLGRSMNRMSLSTHRGIRRTSAVMHGIGSSWYWFNDFWRTYILAGRPVSLGARIFLEQQVRMAAYGYSSAFWNPSEYFRSMRRFIDGGFDQFIAFAETDGVALGGVTDDMFSKVFRVRDRGSVLRWGSRGPDEGFFDAMSSRMRMWMESHNYRSWLLPALDDPDDWATFNAARAEELLNARAGTEHGDFWIKKLNTPGLRVRDVRDALGRSWEEVRQLLGNSDDPDLMAALRAMMTRGRAEIDGTIYELGTREWAEKMESLWREGRWMPVTREIPAEYAAYLPGHIEEGSHNIANAILRYTYSKPDVALSRAPLYRQVAMREYNTLIAYGYSPAKAREVARFNAARRTSEMMFEIGVHTSGEAFWRNLNPFFPAWRELFTTWLLRVPMRLGGAEGRAISWALGTGALTRRVNAIIDGLMAGNALEVTPDGDIVLFGNVSARSLFGILPVPIGLFNEDAPWEDRVKGLVPSLGAPATAVLGWAEDLTRKVDEDNAITAVLENIERVVAPYGTDVSLGPTSLDALFQAFGTTTPWMSGTTRNFQNTMRTSAIIDGMRLWIKDNPRPLPPAGSIGLQKYMETILQPWMSAAIAAGESYAKRMYLQKAFLGAVLPFQFASDPEGKKETEQMWADLEALRDMPHLSSVFGAVINAFLTEHPDMEGYLVGKYIDERSTLSLEEDLKSFFEGVASGNIEIRTPEDWIAFMYGKSTIDFMQRRISQEEQNLREKYGAGGFAEAMLDPEAFSVLNNLNRELDDFREYTSLDESRAEGQTKTFASMMYDYTKFRDERYGRPRVDLSLREERLLAASDAISRFDDLVTLDPARSDNWHATIDKVYAKLGENPGQDWWDQTTNYFYEEVNGPYYERYGALIEQLDDLDYTDPRRDTIFQKLRDLKAEYAERRSFQGVELPTPEEYQFARWTPAEQRSNVAQWATLPPLFLSEFQREQVGYEVPENKQDEVDKLARYSSKAYAATQKKIDAGGDLEDLIEIRDRKIGEYAEELGVGEYYRLQNVPAYRRIDNALDLSSRSTTWKSMMHFADVGRKAIEDAGYSVSGAGAYATAIYEWFDSWVKKQVKLDPELNEIMTELDDAFDGGMGDMVRQVFFGYRPTGTNYAQGPLVHYE